MFFETGVLNQRLLQSVKLFGFRPKPVFATAAAAPKILLTSKVVIGNLNIINSIFLNKSQLPRKYCFQKFTPRYRKFHNMRVVRNEKKTKETPETFFLIKLSRGLDFFDDAKDEFKMLMRMKVNVFACPF